MARRNPFRTEAEAFRLLLVTLAAFTAIALASLLGGWEAGVPVWIVVTVAAGWYYLRPRPDLPPVLQAPAVPHDEHRVLVVANETVAGRTLRDAIRKATEGRQASVLVVCPALNSPIRHWASDEDPARAAANERLQASLAELRRLGVAARGEVGDADPLQAIEDALRTFGADEIVISTHPEGRSHWLERGVVAAARDRFAVPITHVVVDLQAESEAARR